MSKLTGHTNFIKLQLQHRETRAKIILLIINDRIEIENVFYRMLGNQTEKSRKNWSILPINRNRA